MSTGQAHFDRLYAESADPWGYERSAYEQEKYHRTLAAIGSSPGVALEVGCSIGIFTAMLAPRCERLEAIDISPAATARARERVRMLGRARVRRMDATRELPGGPFDLVVCSEVLYYWPHATLRATLERIAGSLRRGGRLVAVNWRGEASDRELSTAEVESAIDAAAALRRISGAPEPGYSLGVWERG